MTSARPNEYAESALVDAILDSQFPPGSVLPGERTLAAQLGVTRPTLREAIQRLSRDGWLTVAHGKPTIVNDFWQVGGLNVLGKLVERQADWPPGFVTQLLEVRLHLAPAYTRAAITHSAGAVVEFLSTAENLADDPDAYAQFDWLLHHKLTVCSRNPIYTLILNGFQGFYQRIARRYFAATELRRKSALFYRDLQVCALAADPASAEALCRWVMEESLAAWEARERDATRNGEG
jgi:GntR family negative regulator for fad regulon and positive regulator of fabA